MAPYRPTWGLALRADASNRWMTTSRACGCIFWGGWGCLWPSKHSFVQAMMNCHNIGVFRGPYTPSTVPKIISACSGGYHPSIWRIGTEHKASCGALGGHFPRQRLWLAMVVLVDVGCWRLTSVQPTVDLSSLLGCKIWTRLLGSWKHVSRSQYVLIRKLWEIKVWFLYLKESSNEWWYMCVSCRILHNPVVFNTCYWWTHVPTVLCDCACRRVYVRGSLVIGLVWVPIQVLLRTRWYLSTL